MHAHNRHLTPEMNNIDDVVAPAHLVELSIFHAVDKDRGRGVDWVLVRARVR